jgi:hypothetical protein
VDSVTLLLPASSHHYKSSEGALGPSLSGPYADLDPRSGRRASATVYFFKAGVYEKVSRQEGTVGVFDFCASVGASLLTSLDRNEFKIPEIIFDPTLVLSPHV